MNAKKRPPRGEMVKRLAAFVFFLRKAPRTAKELEDLLGIERSSAAIWLEAFADEGIVNRNVRKTPTKNAVEYVWVEAQ